MAFVKYLPIIVGVILAGAIAATAQATLPAPSTGLNVTLRVGYPDSLDESDVTDMYAIQLLANQGIHVVPTFYDAPPFSYKGLLSGQQDISFGTTAQSFARGPGGTPPQQTTCVTSYALAGVFLEIANSGITKPPQMLGKSADDFGQGTSSGSLDVYWYSQAGIPTQRDATSPGPSYVDLKTSGGNQARVADLLANKSQAIVVDDFILSDFTSASINNSAHNGPFHVLFYAPTNYYDNCYAVTDSWLSDPTNNFLHQQILVKFIAAIIQAQRYFISNPSALLTFAGGQLPLTAPSEINYTSTFYPGHFTYWPYGAYNLLGNASLSTKFSNTNTFFLAVGSITTPVLNSSVTPYGVMNKWFELQALQSLGAYPYPSQSWVTPSFKAAISAWVPTSIGTPPP